MVDLGWLVTTYYHRQQGRVKGRAGRKNGESWNDGPWPRVSPVLCVVTCKVSLLEEANQSALCIVLGTQQEAGFFFLENSIHSREYCQ